MVEALTASMSHIIVLHLQNQRCKGKAPLHWLHDREGPQGPVFAG
jgi:hypothetical protein